jgi:hypothetical protein
LHSPPEKYAEMEKLQGELQLLSESALLYTLLAHKHCGPLLIPELREGKASHEEDS